MTSVHHSFHRPISMFVLASAALACARSREVIPAEPPVQYTQSDTASLFAPGVISTGDVFSSSFMPDGRTVYFTKALRDGSSMQIMMSGWTSGSWSAPRRAPFSTGEWQKDAHVAPNGRLVYFSAPRRRASGVSDPDGDWDIWTASLEKGDPSEAIRLSTLANSPEHETSPSVTVDVTVFFSVTARVGGAMAQREVAYMSRKLRTTPVRISLAGLTNPGDPYVNPFGRVLIVSATGKDEHTRADLYVVTRGGDGRWGAPRNLGRAVNTDAMEFSPSLSPD
ncbi:MAG: hypothetical protein ABIW79_05420, partial [Gemmatimonas sp.]